LTPSVEHLDTKRFPSLAHLEKTKEYLTYKYKDRKTDLLVVLDNPALEMVLGWQGSPFEGVPKVFAGINGYRPEMTGGRKDITGVSEDQDIEGTLALAKHLHPNAKEAIIIFDTTLSGLALRAETERIRPILEKIIPISFAGEGTFAQLEGRLKGLSKDALVVIMTYVTDAAGRTFRRAESTSLICSASPCPVYAMHETRLGHGIVGGMLIEGKEHGRQAAGLCLKVLSGEAPWSLPVERSSSRAVLDYRVLVRFDVPEALWPPKGIIINKPPSVYEAYGFLLFPLSVTTAVLAITLIILGIFLVRVKRAERVAREKEQDLGTVLEAYPETALALDAEGRILALNAVAAQRLAIGVKDAIGGCVYDLIPEAVGDAGRKHLYEVLSNGKPLQFEDKRGDRLYRHRLIPFTDESGKVARVLVFAQDITEFREREERLERQNMLLSSIRKAHEIFITGGEGEQGLQAVLQLLVKATGSLCGRIDEAPQEMEASAACCFSAFWEEPWVEKEVGMRDGTPSDICAGLRDTAGQAAMLRQVTIVRAGGNSRRQESDPLSETSSNFMGVPLFFAGELVGAGAVAGRGGLYSPELAEELAPLFNTCSAMLWSIRKSREARLQAQTIRESEERFRAVFDSTVDPIMMLEPGRRILAYNKAFCDLFGYERDELKGESTIVLYPTEEDFHRFGDTAYPQVEGGGSYRGELTLRKKDGSLLYVETITSAVKDRGLTALYVAVLRDLTEKKKEEEERERLREQLKQVQKMEAIGTLAGGIAHDFNNILGIIMGSADLAMLEAAPGSGQAENIALLLKAAARAKDLVNQILAFSRQSKQELRPLRIDLVVAEALKFLRSTLPSTIEIKRTLEKSAGLVLADLTQIHQVVMNLCVNAAHAMREKGGVLEVSVSRVEAAASEAILLGLPGAGSYCRLRVSDTGHGISPDILDKIFDPYFTTKKKGEGTGLGLAVVKGIVESHGGAIRVQSELGRGTCFEVFLPLAEGTGEMEDGRGSELPLGNGERILLVDDEPDLLKIVSGMLKSLGYETDVRTGAVDALDAFVSDPASYRLVITDMTMPHMTGLQLAMNIKKIRPDIPVFICTGFSESITAESVKKYGLSGLIMKPVSKADLAFAAAKAIKEGVV
jgi:PAS domain S-box-containing protein